MKTLRAKTLIYFYAMTFGLNGCTFAQHDSLDNQASSMLKNFYTAYMTEIDTGKLPASEMRLDSIKKHYCTTNLLDSINKEFKENELDSDPLINAQDASAKNLKTLSVKRDLEKPNAYVVSYIDGATKRIIVVHLKVIQEKDKLMIASVW